MTATGPEGDFSPALPGAADARLTGFEPARPGVLTARQRLDAARMMLAEAEGSHRPAERSRLTAACVHALTALIADLAERLPDEQDGLVEAIRMLGGREEAAEPALPTLVRLLTAWSPLVGVRDWWHVENAPYGPPLYWLKNALGKMPLAARRFADRLLADPATDPPGRAAALALLKVIERPY